MNPNQITPCTGFSWNDSNRTRRTTRGSSRSDDSPWSNYPQTTTLRTTRTGTYGLGISPLPSPPGETEIMTPGQNPPIQDPDDYQTTGLYGTPTPSTSWTGINPWPLNSSLSMYRPHTNVAPQLGRAPWPGLANVLEDRTLSPSPPPVELSIYHPLQTTTQTRPQTLTPSSTGMSPSRFESAPTSPKTSPPVVAPTMMSEVPESSSSSKPEEKRTLSTSMALISSGPNFPKSTERSWVLPEQWHGSSDDRMSRTERQMASLAHESPWPSTSPLTEGNHSVLLTPLPYLSDLRPTTRGRFGTLPPDEGYYTFDPEPLMSKVPWSTPSPVSYGRRDHGAPERPSKFLYGYAARYDFPMPLPDLPPYQRQGTYRGKGTSHLIAGGDHEIEGG